MDVSALAVPDRCVHSRITECVDYGIGTYGTFLNRLAVRNVHQLREAANGSG